jgi:hypothetical protein
VRDFVTKVEMLAEEKTTAWAQRFSERLSGFDRNPDLKVTLSTQQTPGSAGTVASDGASSAAGRPMAAPAKENLKSRPERCAQDGAGTHAAEGEPKSLTANGA